jgi:phosphoribosylformimino-5-aminoimidazole carboxamide ribonucleotide (ProFAR) isomerase
MKKTKNKVIRINWNFETMKWENLTVSQIEIWQALYKNIDVVRILTKDIPQAIDKKVDRIDGKITKRGWVKEKKVWHWKETICNWLAREQMRASGIL